MLLPALLSLVTLQQPTAPAPSPPIAKVEVKPSGGEVPIGGKLQFTARALDSVGAEVPRAEIEWFVGGDVGEVDSLGVFTGGYQGFARVTAVGFLRGVPNSQVFGVALVRVLPERPASIVLDARPARLVAVSHLSPAVTEHSHHRHRRSDPLTFTPSHPRVATVRHDRRLNALSAAPTPITPTS